MNVNVNVNVVSVRVVTDAETGPTIWWPSGELAKKGTAATGNGRKAALGLGYNIIAALQRNERLGRSWRGSAEGG